MQSQAADLSPTDVPSESASVEGTSENVENSATDAAATSQEVDAVIAELETYRQRLVDETMDIARKIKLPKKAAQAQVDNHPEIAKVAQLIQGLRDRQGESQNHSSASDAD
ncbi:MAG: hypothetical protein ACFCBU_12690 [Cyanophyceae cyanobacterium]